MEAERRRRLSERLRRARCARSVAFGASLSAWVLGATTGHAYASPGWTDGGLRMVWRAPDDCPQEASVRARVDEYLGTSEAGPRSPVAAEVAIERNLAGRYELRLRLTTANESPAERALAADSCEAVAHAAALLIAMAIDPKLAGDAAPGAADTGPSRPVKAAPAPTNEQHHADTADHATSETVVSRQAIWGLGLGALIDQGSLPGASLGLAADAEATLAWLRFSLGAQLFIPSEGNVSQIPTATIDVSAAMATTRVCASWSMPSLELGPCVSGEIGQLKGRAEGIRVPHTGSALWLGLGGSVQARIVLGPRFRLGVDTGAVVPHSRRRFLVRTDGGAIAAHRVAAAALRLGLGITYVFE